MALKTNSNGTFTVTSKADARKALLLMKDLQEDIDFQMKEHGITDMMKEATELKKAATRYFVDKGITKLDVDDEQYAMLRQDGYDRRWVATREELATLDAPANAMPLRTILRRKYEPDTFKRIWMRITKRVVDPDALQEAVDEGTLTEDEISPAFVEKLKTPYIRLYSKGA